MRITNNHKHITRDGKEIGYLQLVKDSGLRIPELEYLVDEYYQNQGIMSVELPKYLEWLKGKDITQLCALVKPENLASIKILKNNRFIKTGQFKIADCYITDLNWVY